MKAFFPVVALLALLLGIVPAKAEDIQRIAAIVNDEVISMYDLVARVKMVIKTSRLPDGPETRRRIVPQVLRTLIDERLQLQEARRLNLKVTDDELQRAVDSLEERNDLAPGGFDEFLTRNDIEKSTVMGQLRAAFAWSKVVNQRIRPRVTIGQEEVDEVLDRIKRNQSRSEYLVGEIFLAVDSPEDEPSVRQAAERLATQIRNGATFAVLAEQFSQSASASSGGDVGWVQPGQLDPVLDDALATMSPGELSDPIRTLTGFTILLLRDQRIMNAKAPNERAVSLRQIVLKHPPDASADQILAQRELAQRISNTAESCDDMARLGSEEQVTSSGQLQKVMIKDLSEPLRSLALELDIEQPSPPISGEDNISVVMVCERDAEANLPSRDEITNSLGRERMNILTRRYLRDLRLGAFLDVRV